MSTSHYFLSFVDYLQSCADRSNTITTVKLTGFLKKYDLVDHYVALNNLYAWELDLLLSNGLHHSQLFESTTYAIEVSFLPRFGQEQEFIKELALAHGSF